MALVATLGSSTLRVVGTADLPRPIDFVEVDFEVSASGSSATAALEAASKKAAGLEKAMQKFVKDKEEDIDVSTPDVEL